MAGPSRLLVFNHVVFRCGSPDDKVGPEAEASAEEGDEEDDADHRGVDIKVFGDAAAHAGDVAVGGAAGQTTIAVVVVVIVVLHNSKLVFKHQN